MFFLFPGFAQATEIEDFERARHAYTDHQYEQAVALFEAMVGGPTPAIRSPLLIRESRKFLAISYLFVERRNEAIAQFQSILDSDPDFRLEEAAFPAEVYRVFEEVRSRLDSQRRDSADSERRARENASIVRRENLVELVEIARSPHVEVPHDPLLAWVPFGAGQFQNGNDTLGWFFLAAETLSLASAAGTLAVYLPLESEWRQNTTPAERSTLVTPLQVIQVANWISSGLFGSLALIGVIEAQINFVPSHQERRVREVPDRILDRLDLVLTPSTVNLRASF